MAVKLLIAAAIIAVARCDVKQLQGTHLQKYTNNISV